MLGSVVPVYNRLVNRLSNVSSQAIDRLSRYTQDDDNRHNSRGDIHCVISIINVSRRSSRWFMHFVSNIELSLFGVTCTQAIHYFQRCYADSWFIIFAVRYPLDIQNLHLLISRLRWSLCCEGIRPSLCTKLTLM